MEKRMAVELRGKRQSITPKGVTIEDVTMPLFITKGNNVISLSIVDIKTNILLTVDIKPALEEIIEVILDE